VGYHRERAAARKRKRKVSLNYGRSSQHKEKKGPVLPLGAGKVRSRGLGEKRGSLRLDSGRGEHLGILGRIASRLQGREEDGPVQSIMTKKKKEDSRAPFPHPETKVHLLRGKVQLQRA